MSNLKKIIFTLAVFSTQILGAQTVVKMEMAPQADQPLSVVTLFDEELPVGIPVVLGLMGYAIEGGVEPFQYEWKVNGSTISTEDVVVFTPQIGDHVALNVMDGNQCVISTKVNLNATTTPEYNNPDFYNSIKVYPTVVSGSVNIEIPKIDNGNAMVRVFNLNGKVVLKEEMVLSGSLILDIEPGVYFVSVKLGAIHKVEKIIAK